MFGSIMSINLPATKDGEITTVTLRPIWDAEELRGFPKLMSDPEVSANLGRMGGMVFDDEKEWWASTRSSKDRVLWGITVDGEDTLIGTTDIHKIGHLEQCGTTGIVIADKRWWGKGVAYRAHLLRTLYAADYLNLKLLESQVRTRNHGSRKALLKVGYTVTDTVYRTGFRVGEMLDT